MNRIDATALSFLLKLQAVSLCMTNCGMDRMNGLHFPNMICRQHFLLSSFGELRDDQRYFREVQTAPSSSA